MPASHAIEPDPALRDLVPAPGEAVALAPGLAWHRVPLDGSPDHVNLWLVADGEGTCAIDAGPTRPDTEAAWAALARGPLRDAPLARVLVTHLHADHLGYAHALCARPGVPLWMSAGDWAQARRALADDGPASREAAVELMRRNGLDDPERLDAMRARPAAARRLMPAVPDAFVAVRDGDALRIGARTWRAIGGRGHAPEHLAFHCASLGVLVAGDLLLPSIAAHVGVTADEPDGDPLGEHLESLARFDGLPEDTLVLPSHGVPFRGPDRRLAQLRAHHARRLDALRAACGRPRSALELVPEPLRRRLSAHRLGLALTGTLAHLHRHWHAGRLRRVEGDDGVLRFERVRAGASGDA